MIWTRKTALEWSSLLDDDSNDISRWFHIRKIETPTSTRLHPKFGFLPVIGVVPGQARANWMQPLTLYPFKTFKGAETVCMMEYEKLIA